jgi:hypothetical protein
VIKDQDQREGINLESVYRSLLKIVANLEESQYTEETSRQTEVVEHPDLADPASDVHMPQG